MITTFLSNSFARLIQIGFLAFIAMISPILMVFPMRSAFAHASGQSFVMLLPTGVYTVTGVIVVGLTIVMLAVMPPGGLSRLIRPRAVFLSPRSRRLMRCVHAFAGVGFFFLIMRGTQGSTDPLRNPLPLGFWVVFWMALVMVEGLLFSVWSWLNPWVFAYHLARRTTGWRVRRHWPQWAGSWPAVITLFAFAGFTLAYPAPNDPLHLARVIMGYWLFTLAGMLIFGFRTWSRHVEVFSLFMAWFGRLRMLAIYRRRLCIGLPGWQLIHRNAPNSDRHSLSPIIFVLMMLGVGSFDGFNETFFWLGWINVNPLDFPGRSAIIFQTLGGLLLANLLLVAVFAILIWLGHLAASETAHLEHGLADLIRIYAPSLLPIALAYHIAHYLPSLLVDGQYVLLMLDGLFGPESHMLGLGGFHVTDGFFKHRDTVRIIWLSQAGCVVAGHVISVLLAHHMAGGLYRNRWETMISQMPLAFFMVSYTWLGLWLLASPKGG
jgi:hypothetical protein